MYPSYPAATTTDPFVTSGSTSVPYVNITANYSNTEPVIVLANVTRVDYYSYAIYPQDP